MCRATSEAHADLMMNDDLTRTMVRDRQRDLARAASISSTSRLTRRVLRRRRKRNPDQANVAQPVAH